MRPSGVTREAGKGGARASAEVWAPEKWVAAAGECERGRVRVHVGRMWTKLVRGQGSWHRLEVARNRNHLCAEHRHGSD